MWIESMNTVMDDNKMLTLVSQERIPLSKSMRLILEVSHLKNATPATVSRGGVLFVNEFDIGWKPYWESWIQKFKNQKSDPQDLAYTTFVLNLGQYCDDNFIEEVRKRPAITPMCLMAYIQSLTHIIDFMYEELRSEKKYTEFFKKLKDGSEPELNARFGSYEEAMKLIYEGVFVFAMIWSFGGPQSDERIWFSNSIKQRSTKIRFPEAVN
jgi:dynein heavy chain